MSVYSGFDFLRVNCAEMPADLLEIELFGKGSNYLKSPQAATRTGRGKLETGQKGTLLLDEITQMPLTLQSRLAKVLQDKRFVRPGDPKPVDVHVRVLAASSDKLDRALAEKRLDADFYYRLSAFTVHVPALRQRKEEIKLLLRYTMHKVAKHYGLPPRDFTQSALDACQNHSWPGNLRELEAFVKRYLVAGDEEFSVSAWELATRSRLGKWPDVERIVAEFPSLLRRSRFVPLAITVEHAGLAGSLAGAHRDPFDRMLIAQAQSEQVPLLTRDRAMTAYGEQVTILRFPGA